AVLHFSLGIGPSGLIIGQGKPVMSNQPNSDRDEVLSAVPVPGENQITAKPGAGPRPPSTPSRSGRHVSGAVIETHNLAKHYGRIEALKGVSLGVQKGEIFGLLGQNGAGKTTMVKILLGITKRSDGEATLLGEPVGTAPIR